MNSGVYVLRDPINGIVRYVGQSKRIKKRWQQERTNPQARSGLLGRWIDELDLIGLAPLFEVIYSTDDSDQLDRVERYWISKYAMTVLNVYAGRGLWVRDEILDLHTPRYC